VRCLLRLPRFATALVLSLAASGPRAAHAVVPHHNHVAVVIMENKSYAQASVQPYTASLIAGGAVFTLSFAITHPSQPNYIGLWFGSTLGFTTDNCPLTTPLSFENLGHACEAAGLSWRAYSENLAVVGSTACSYDGNALTGLYTRKHDPWTYCANVDHNRERPYTDLAADITGGTLPNLVFVIPNNCHNTHNSSTPGCGIADGDAWLAANLPTLQAALGPAGLLILTWDEDDGSAGNQILTVFSGPLVIPGSVSTHVISHYTVTRTICDALGIPPMASAATAVQIDGIWFQPVAVTPASWGRLKLLYR
jgi:acid phosphatase